MRHSRLFPRCHGFSLIELMVALAVAGILAAIAYPAFTSQMQRGRRADAVAAVTAVMQAQERYRSNSSSYASTLAALNVNISQVTPHYHVALTAGANGIETGYVVTLTPVVGGKQAADITCKSMVMTLTGSIPTYSATGDPNNSGTDQDTTSLCWPK